MVKKSQRAVLLLYCFFFLQGGGASAVVDESGLIHLWDFTNGTLNITYDEVGNMDLTVYNTKYFERGEYVFDATANHSYMRSDTNVTSSIIGAGSKTILVWFNSTNSPDNSNSRYMAGFGKHQSPWDKHIFLAHGQFAPHDLQVQGPNGLEWHNSSFPIYYDHQYHMAVYTYDNVTGRSVLYMNNTLLANDTVTAHPFNNTPFLVSERPDILHNGENEFNGSISLIAVYNRSITSSEVADWYAEGPHFDFNQSPSSPTPEQNIWSLSSKNVFVTNTSRDVAIGAQVPSQRLHVNGSANVTGTMHVGRIGINHPNPDHDLRIGDGTYSELDAGEAQFTTSSSREYKQNIVPIRMKVLEKIARIPVNTYDFKPEYCGELQSCTDKLGLIAEDFHTIFGRGSEKELNGQEVQMALWLAVQELHEENALLKKTLCGLTPEAEICS